jgi:L-histidine N-alpha-methyltransferase
MQCECTRDLFAAEVRAGLTRVPKSLPCRWLYDQHGSVLFEEICTTPEYYLPQAEREILERHAQEIAALLASPPSLLEFGSGSASKTRVLIEACLRQHERVRFIPVDISPWALEACLRVLSPRSPGLDVLTVAGDYAEGLRQLARENGRARLVIWLGSSVGNLHRPEASAFLRHVGAFLGAGDRVLVGIDLRKDRSVLEAAYDDARGVTARFNKNILARINRELGGHFEVETFSHVVRYDEAAGRMEMHLESAVEQRVCIDRLALEVPFRVGETIHTENSYKYSPEEIAALACAAKLRLDRRWLDSAGRFSLNLMAPRE